MSISDETIAEVSAAAREKAKRVEKSNTFHEGAKRTTAYFAALGASSVLAAAQVWGNDMARTTFLQLAVFGFMYAFAILIYAFVTGLTRAFIEGDTAWERENSLLVDVIYLLLLLAAVTHLAMTAWPLLRCAFDISQCGAVR
jgi:hypothetical protein